MARLVLPAVLLAALHVKAFDRGVGGAVITSISPLSESNSLGKTATGSLAGKKIYHLPPPHPSLPFHPPSWTVATIVRGHVCARNEPVYNPLGWTKGLFSEIDWCPHTSPVALPSVQTIPFDAHAFSRSGKACPKKVPSSSTVHDMTLGAILNTKNCSKSPPSFILCFLFFFPFFQSIGGTLLTITGSGFQRGGIIGRYA